MKTPTKNTLAVGRVRNGCCPFPTCRAKALKPSAWPKYIAGDGTIDQALVCLSCGHTFLVTFRVHYVETR